MSSWPSPRPKWSSRYPADLRTKWPGKQRSLGVEIHKIHWVQKKTLGGGFKKKHSGGSQQKNYYASLLLAFVNQSMKKWYEKKAPTIAIRPIKNMKMLDLRSMTSKSWHHAASSKPQGSKPWYWCAGRPQTRGKYGSWQMALLGLLVKGVCNSLRKRSKIQSMISKGKLFKAQKTQPAVAKPLTWFS